MTTKRWVLTATAFLVTALGVVFAVLGWEQANIFASLISALVSVAAIGVAVWAALPATTRRGVIQISRTGRATTQGGGTANTGLVGRAGSAPDRLHVSDTGDAKSDGDANTGVRLD